MEFFNLILIDPMLNMLVALYNILFNNFGLSIIVFTIAVRVATFPLTLKQTKQMRAMSGLQPKMKALQERFAKDPQKRAQETMKLYKHAGVNPIGCLGPMVIQLPIWIGLYQALIKSLGTTPDHLVGLSQRLYSWNPFANSSVPIDSNFFGLDLANPDTTLIIPILVGASTWAQQKMTMMPSADARQQSTNSMMLWMMPLMLGFFSLTFPSGLALYWIISNLIGVAMQYYITRDISPLMVLKPAQAPEPAAGAATESAQDLVSEEMRNDAADTRVHSQDSGGGQRDSSKRARRRPRRGRGRNTKPR